MQRIITASLIGIIITALVSYVSSRRGVSVPNFSIRPPLLDRGRIHYKTTYACEGNPLHLNCEDGRNIHLVRANYGRFSISICNDGGRLDWSVNCMSYRSFLIMQDRCSQKSNCSVIVSSKMFGDPCPGTLKYLEVQYHCVHEGTSSATTTRRPPIMLNIPLMPASSNTSSFYPSVQPTTMAPPNEDVIAITTETAAHPNIGKDDANVVIASSVSSSTTASPSSTSQSIFNHIEKVESAEVRPHHRNTFDVSLLKTITSTLPPSIPLSRIPTPNQEDIPPPNLPPPPPPSLLPIMTTSDLRLDYCPPIFVRSLFWNWTRRGESAIQKCPGGATGSVRWECIGHHNTRSIDWVPERPDFRECRSLWLDNLEERLSNGDPVIRIANELALMTLTKALFSEDLKRIAFVVQETLARAVVSMENLQSVEVWHRHQVLKELLIFIVEAVSNLLDNAQDDAWLDLTMAERKRVASKLLEGLEESAMLLADNTNQDGSFTVAKPNVLVAVHVLDTRIPMSLQFPTVEDTKGTKMEWIRMEDSLFLPAQALLEYSTNGLAKAAFLAYYRIEDLLKPDAYTMHSNSDDSNRLYSMVNKLQNVSSSLAINSRVIGASLGNSHSGDNNENIVLSHPVTVILRHIQEENVSSPRCVYWNVERLDWQSDGCWMESTNATHTVCMCNHLTHFALLMDIRPIELLAPDTNCQKLTAIIGCAVTLLCFAFIAIILSVVNAGNTEAISIHRNLCMTLLITELAFLFGIYRTDLPFVCGLTAGILHFFLLSAFFWTFLESFDLYFNLIDVYDTLKSSRRVMWYYVIAYGGPFAIILISLCIDPHSYGTSTHCWLRVDNYFCFSFVGPAIGVVFGGLVFVCIACFILYNNSAVSATVKGIEEVKLETTKSGIKWVAVLLILQCITWTFGLIHINVQSSTAVAIAFTIFNITLGLYIVLFCIFKTDNIQHLKIIRSLPFVSYCFEEINCANTKTSVVHSDAYTTRPVVTQVIPTQVAGIVPSVVQQQTTHSLLGSSPCSPSSQITSFRPPPWNSPLEKDNSTSTILDRQYILAQHERDHLATSKGGTTGPILVNPIVPASDPKLNTTIGDITAAALGSQNLADYESRIHQIRNNSMTRVPKSRRKIRYHGNHFDDGISYGIHPSVHSGHIHPHLYNQYIEHIYETIDSDSIGSGVYDHHGRYMIRTPAAVSQINDFYSGANVTVNPTCTADDEWSQNSSSSYGPLYDDRPLLIASHAIANNSPNLSRPLMFHGKRYRHHSSNSNVYDPSSPVTQRNRTRNLESSRVDTFDESKPKLVSAGECNVWNIYPDSNVSNPELPDLLQYPTDSSNNSSVLLEGIKVSNKKAKASQRVTDTSNDGQMGVSNAVEHTKLSTYC